MTASIELEFPIQLCPSLGRFSFGRGDRSYEITETVKEMDAPARCLDADLVIARYKRLRSKLIDNLLVN